MKNVASIIYKSMIWSEKILKYLQLIYSLWIELLDIK